MKKKHPVFDALWFNVVASIISVIVYANYIWELTSDDSSAKPIAMIIIWTVIGFHFFQKTYLCLKDRRADPDGSVG